MIYEINCVPQLVRFIQVRGPGTHVHTFLHDAVWRVEGAAVVVP